MMIAAKRKITPCTRLKLHEDAYKVALDDGGAPEEASRAVVQAMDRVYYSAAFFSSHAHQRSINASCTTWSYDD